MEARYLKDLVMSASQPLSQYKDADSYWMRNQDYRNLYEKVLLVLEDEQYGLGEVEQLDY